MERLTIHLSEGVTRCTKVSTDLCYSHDNCFDCEQHKKMVDRLAAYEDTGLTPEKIVAMKAELEAERYRHDRVQDFCTAEGELLSRAKRDLRDISACFTCTGAACGRGPATPAESGTRCSGYKWDSGVKDREGVEFDYGAED